MARAGIERRRGFALVTTERFHVRLVEARSIVVRGQHIVATSN
jgi:hypothetical protein